MLKRLEVFLIAAVFILMTAIILIIYSKQREQEFTDHNYEIQKTVVSGAAYALNLQLLEKQRHVHLFAKEYVRLFQHLNNNPANENVQQEIKNRLQHRFPDFFAFTLTDSNGIPKIQNIDSFVGHACQTDLNTFSKNLNTIQRKSVQNKIYIHPQPFNYHYDVMAPLFTSGGDARIFFISFYLNEIVDILKTREIPGQNLILVRQSDPSLIEMTSSGARDKLKRNIRLSKEEQRLIKVYENIPGTDWRLVDLPDPSYKENYVKGLWMEAITILIIVTLAIIILIFALIKVASKRGKNY